MDFAFEKEIETMHRLTFKQRLGFPFKNEIKNEIETIIRLAKIKGQKIVERKVRFCIWKRD